MPAGRIPKLVASSVVRGAQQGESHGGVYLLDIEGGCVELKLDWNRTDIDTSGRGGDRGLRGIDFYQGKVLIAANAEVLVLDQDFNRLDSFTNRYLAHCHEISVRGALLCLASTGYDSILLFDLAARRFIKGFHLGIDGRSLKLRSYDPEGAVGPAASRRFHINMVKCTATGIHFSGLRTPGLMRTDGRSISLIDRLPEGTHNAQLAGGGLLYNDTAADRICHRVDGTTLEMSVPRFARQDIVNIDRYESSVARPCFARGLCTVSPALIAGGSSPSTVAVYELASGARIAMRNISMDVRNAIHGLAVWPF